MPHITINESGLHELKPRQEPRKGEQMLVLTRRRDERIMIGDTISITVVEVRGDKVRIGIDAPKDVPVHRQEIYDQIREREQQQ